MPSIPPPEPSAVASKSPRRAAFGYIFVTAVLDMLAMGITAPVLPKLVAQLEGGDIARAAVTMGAFGSMLAAMQFVFAPLMGAVSDRYGRRPIVMLTSFGFFVDFILMALAPSAWWLFPGRVLSGITSSFPAGGAYIADASPPERRAAHIGMMWGSVGIGLSVGPTIGGYLGSLDIRLPFYVAAAVSVVNAAYGLFILPESLAPERRAPIAWRRANPIGSWKLLRSTPLLFGLTAALVLHFAARGALSDLFVLYSDHRFGWDERTVGYAVSAIGVASMFVSVVLTAPMVNRFGERRVLLVGTFCGVIGYTMLGLAPVGWLFLLAILPKSLLNLGSPAIQALMTRQVSHSEQGQLVGATTSAIAITGVLSPLLFTRVFAAAIDKNAVVSVPGAPFLLAATLLVGSLLFAWKATSTAANRGGVEQSPPEDAPNPAH